jgi:hypothetical protein
VWWRFGGMLFHVISSVAVGTGVNRIMLSQDISELRWPLQIHTLLVSQPWYGEGGEAIAQKASCFSLALPIFHSPLTVTLANILRPVQVLPGRLQRAVTSQGFRDPQTTCRVDYIACQGHIKRELLSDKRGHNWTVCGKNHESADWVTVVTAANNWKCVASQ